MATEIEVEIEEPEQRRRSITIALPVTLGRSDSCGVQFADPKVSGEHVKLYELDGGIRLKDLGSRNGTTIEPGGRLPSGAEVVFQDRMVLKIGDSSVRLKPRKARVDQTIDAGPNRAMAAAARGGSVEVDDALLVTYKRPGPPQFRRKSADPGDDAQTDLRGTSPRSTPPRQFPPTTPAPEPRQAEPAAAAAPAVAPAPAPAAPRTADPKPAPVAPAPAEAEAAKQEAAAPPKPDAEDRRPTGPRAQDARERTILDDEFESKGFADQSPKLLLATRTAREVRSIDAQLFRLGRVQELEWPLADKRVSNEHCALRFGASGWTLTDLGSANGTYVGKERLTSREPRPLQPPASFRFADTEFYFFLADPAVCADALPVQTRALQSLVRRRRISRDERDLFLAQARDERRDLGEIVLREKRDVSVADWMEALRLAERPSNRKWIVAAVVGAILAIGALVILRQRGWL